MLVLADTCTAIWLLERPEAISAAAQSVLNDPEHRFLVSAASLVEVAALCRKGRITLDFDQVRTSLSTLGFEEVPITGATARRVANLPSIHSDPFDRMLVAQAQLLGAAILTPDAKIAAYDVRVIW